MKSTKLMCLIALAVFAALAIPVRLAAQEQNDQNAKKKEHHHYQVIDLRTFGGANSYVGTQPVLQILNNQGVVAGVAETAIPSPNCINPFSGTNSFSANDCLQTYGFKWQSGELRRVLRSNLAFGQTPFCILPRNCLTTRLVRKFYWSLS